MSKKENYEYLEMLFLKRTKEEVLEQLTLKCEELLNLRNAYEKLTIEDMKKANIINELEKHCETMLNIFEKMSEEQKQEQLDKYKIYDNFLRKIKELKENK